MKPAPATKIQIAAKITAVLNLNFGAIREATHTITNAVKNGPNIFSGSSGYGVIKLSELYKAQCTGNRASTPASNDTGNTPSQLNQYLKSFFIAVIYSSS